MGIIQDNVGQQDGLTLQSYKAQRDKIGLALISGVGFLADAYDLFVIDFVVAILAATTFVEPSSSDKGLIVSSTLAGAVAGQLFFGFAADFIGRRTMFVTTAFLVICGSLTSAVVGWGYMSRIQYVTVFHQLAFCRFWLGFGIGGEYPLSATVTSESESKYELLYGVDYSAGRGIFWYLSHKPNSIAAVFSMQGFGMLFSPLIVLLCISTGVSLEATWRICLGVGAIPSAIAFAFRWRMHETAAFEKAQREYSIAETASTSTPVANCVKKKEPDVSPTSSEAEARELRSVENSNTQVDSLPCSLHPSDDYTVKMHYNEKEVKDDHPQKESCDYISVPIVTRCVEEKNEGPPASYCTKKQLRKHLKRSWHILKEYRYVLLGTSLTWFLIDITLYGTGSFKSSIVETWLSNEERPFQKGRRLYDAGTNVEFVDWSGEQQISDLQSGLRQNTDFSSIFDASQKVHPVLWNSRKLQGTENLGRRVYSRERILLQAKYVTIVALLAIPGYVLSLLFIHRTGIKRLQFWGFIAVAVAFVCLGIEQLFVSKELLPSNGYIRALELVLFGLTFLCSNFGPNTTTFILPTQVYPTIVRATCHGFSAAMGKLGGVFGTSMFEVVKRECSLGWLLVMCGGVALLGAACTLLIPDDINKVFGVSSKITPKSTKLEIPKCKSKDDHRLCSETGAC